MLSEVDRLRRLRYRAKYRGCKENDVLVRGFVEFALQGEGDFDVAALEEFLERTEADIWDLAFGQLLPKLQVERDFVNFVTQVSVRDSG